MCVCARVWEQHVSAHALMKRACNASCLQRKGAGSHARCPPLVPSTAVASRLLLASPLAPCSPAPLLPSFPCACGTRAHPRLLLPRSISRHPIPLRQQFNSSLLSLRRMRMCLECPLVTLASASRNPRRRWAARVACLLLWTRMHACSPSLD